MASKHYATERAIARFVASLWILSLAGCQTLSDIERSKLYQKQFNAGEVLYEGKCRTEAGDRIYRTVPEVEGILLLKVRPTRGDAQLRDQLWPGAAFANESYGEEYIASFLAYEQGLGDPNTAKPMQITREMRGYLTNDRRPESRPGYAWVDVQDANGKRWRYTGSYKDVPTVSSVLIGGDGKTRIVNRFVLEKHEAPDPSPRYGVTYEDYVVPEERALWVAGGKVSIVDLSTSETIAERVQYHFSWGGVAPWLRGPICPAFGGTSDGYTRKFVDQVLIPKLR